ncbi:MAG TPA: hypothetical protein VFM02_01470 [Candidatus Paceibacterota bacterium]|nr:hypothetical protein [Candidatus Paceibacterota bacterium]
MYELEALLRKYDIPLETWGKGEARTIEDLLREVNEEKIVLESMEWKLIAHQRELSVAVFHKDRRRLLRLHESWRVSFDDRAVVPRQRSSLVVKLRTEEAADTAAASRLVRETLGVESAKIVSGGGGNSFNLESYDYPGLFLDILYFNFTTYLTKEVSRTAGYCKARPDGATFFVWLDARYL